MEHLTQSHWMKLNEMGHCYLHCRLIFIGIESNIIYFAIIIRILCGIFDFDELNGNGNGYFFSFTFECINWMD